MTSFSDQLFHLGGVPVLPGSLVPFGPNANYYFVDPANGNNDDDGLTLETAVADIGTAYGRATANQHDVIFYIAGSSSISRTTALTWSKNYTHLIGITAPTRVAQRARIFAGADALSPFITVSATGCIFANLYIFQGRDDATSLINVSVTGGRNYFFNVHFAGGGHATQAVDGGASLLLNGAEECTFEKCTIGIDTIAAGNGMAGMRIDGDAKRCIFEACQFTLYAGNAGAKFVEVVDSAGFDRYILWRDCLFINDAAGTTMTEAFTVPAGMGSATHRLLLHDCSILGVGDVEDNDRGIVYMNMGTITGGGNAGIMQVTNTT